MQFFSGAQPGPLLKPFSGISRNLELGTTSAHLWATYDFVILFEDRRERKVDGAPPPFFVPLLFPPSSVGISMQCRSGRKRLIRSLFVETTSWPQCAMP